MLKNSDLVFKVVAERDKKFLSAIAGMNCYWHHRENPKLAQFFVEYSLGRQTYPIEGTKLLSFDDLGEAKEFLGQVSDSPHHIFLCRAGNPKRIDSITHPGDVLTRATTGEYVFKFWKQLDAHPSGWYGKTLNHSVSSDWLMPIARLDIYSGLAFRD